MRQRTVSIAVNVLSTALAFCAAATASPAFAQAVDGNRLSLDGLQDGDSNDRFIVKYREGSRAQADSVVRTQSLQRAGTGARARVMPLRRLATGADVVTTDRPLDRVQAEAVMRAIAADPDVEYVEVDARAQPHAGTADPLYASRQWHYFENDGGARANWAWQRAKGAGTVIAVLDTGITRHPDLNNKVLAGGYDFMSVPAYAGDGNGRDGNPADPGDWVAAGTCGPGSAAQDSSWHGTHVAGTAAAQTSNGIGVAGMAPFAKILPVRVLGKCGGYGSDIADGIVWASGGAVSGVPSNRHSAEVINLSLGGRGACSRTYQAAITSATRRGSVVVASAGNDNASVANAYPANCSGVIAVGAMGRDGSRASYSNRGERVDLSAPGGGFANSRDLVFSTYNDGRRAPGSASYGYLAGTSMAAPHVSGTIALMQGIRARTPAGVETILKRTAHPFITACDGCGAGMLDAEAAVNATLGRYYATTGAARQITENGGQLRSPITVDRSGKAPSKLRVGVYIRHPRPTDLLIALLAPDGKYYRLHENSDTGINGINRTYTVDASASNARGQWNLTYRDDYTGQTGTLRRWTMIF